jgi:signal transduction histidine kinase
MRSNFSMKKISTKILFWLIVLTTFTSVAILFTTVVKVSNDNIKVTRDNLEMLSTAVFQNLQNIMNSGDTELMKQAEKDTRNLHGVEFFEIYKSKKLLEQINASKSLPYAKEVEDVFSTKTLKVIELNEDNKHTLRMIKPMSASQKCLQCHTTHELGEVIGVIDLSFSLNHADDNLHNIIQNIIITSLVLGLITLLIIFFVVRRATMPIEGLKRGFIRLLKSDQSYSNLKLQIRSSDEIGEVVTLFNEYLDKLSTELIDDAKKFAESILDAQPNIIVSTNIQTQSLQTVNQAFLKFFDVESIEDFQKKYGKCICDTFLQDEQNTYIQKDMGDERWYEFINNRPLHLHKVLIQKEEQKYIFTVSTNHFKIAKKTYTVSVFHNITELEKLKDELLEFNQKLEYKVQKEIEKNKKQEELILRQEKIAALGEMMDAIAHQWKQPLSLIGLGVDELQMKKLLNGEITSEDLAQASSEVNEQINHLVNTIDEFRRFFRPNQKYDIVNIKESLLYVKKLMHDVLLKNNIVFEIQGDDSLEYELIDTEFRHIFINLINNSKDAFIENNIENKSIKINIFSHKEYIFITFTDNAGGIRQDVIDTVFKANVTTKEEGKGTGIGLYLVTQILEKLNATIEVENTQTVNDTGKVEKGAIFTIKLPLSIDINS